MASAPHGLPDMTRTPQSGMLVMISCGLAACSASPEMATSAAVAPPAQTAAAAAPAYQLSEKELKMNCKQLTGTMKVRIVQMSAATSDGTFVARGMQAGAVKIWGGPTHGTDPGGEGARDRALLKPIISNSPSRSARRSTCRPRCRQPRQRRRQTGVCPRGPAAVRRLEFLN